MAKPVLARKYGRAAKVARASARGSEIAIAERTRLRREWTPMSQPLTNATKRDLKARAQRLEPLVKLGHGGMSEGFLKSLDAALTAHGLVKIKFTDFKDEKKTLGLQIAEKTGSVLVQRVGHVAVYFRAKPDAPLL